MNISRNDVEQLVHIQASTNLSIVVWSQNGKYKRFHSRPGQIFRILWLSHYFRIGKLDDPLRTSIATEAGVIGSCTILLFYTEY